MTAVARRVARPPARIRRLGAALGAALVTWCTGAARPALAQALHGQYWEVIPETDHATVGDTITLRFRVRLDERDLLFDTVPRPVRTPPDGIRILSVDKLERQPDRLFTGRARIAFYRPGRQSVPIFQLPFMRSVKGLSRGEFASDSATIEVAPVLTAGASATLRDIKEPPPRPAPRPLELAGGVAALAAAGWLAWRARRRPPLALPRAPLPSAEPAGPPSHDPFDVALARLAAIEAEQWAARDVARHYAAVADALRDFLESRGIPARERTTLELRWTLPAALLADGGFEDVFGAADLVKFAHWRPWAGEATGFLEAARGLLETWREAGVEGEVHVPGVVAGAAAVGRPA